MFINNNNEFLCANILKDQAQWCDKTNGLSNLVILKQCASCQWMNDGAMKLRTVGSRCWWNVMKLCSFFTLTLAGSEFLTVGAATEKVRVPAFVFSRGM